MISGGAEVNYFAQCGRFSILLTGSSYEKIFSEAFCFHRSDCKTPFCFLHIRWFGWKLQLILLWKLWILKKFAKWFTNTRCVSPIIYKACSRVYKYFQSECGHPLSAGGLNFLPNFQNGQGGLTGPQFLELEQGNRGAGLFRGGGGYNL